MLPPNLIVIFDLDHERRAQGSPDRTQVPLEMHERPLRVEHGILDNTYIAFLQQSP